jgi:hypothetical protein
VIIQSGIFLYADEVVCDIRIVKHDMRPGTGDPFDEPWYRDDQKGEFYEIQYGSPSQRGKYLAGGGYFDSLDAALISAEEATHGTVRWNVE